MQEVLNPNHPASIWYQSKAWDMVFKIKNIFVFLSKKAFDFLIGDMYEKNSIPTSFVEILQDLVDQRYFGYDGKLLVFNSSEGNTSMVLNLEFFQ